jgi:hypothetical protein
MEIRPITLAEDNKKCAIRVQQLSGLNGLRITNDSGVRSCSFSCFLCRDMRRRAFTSSRLMLKSAHKEKTQEDNQFHLIATTTSCIYKYMQHLKCTNNIEAAHVHAYQGSIHPQQPLRPSRGWTGIAALQWLDTIPPRAGAAGHL